VQMVTGTAGEDRTGSEASWLLELLHVLSQPFGNKSCYAVWQSVWHTCRLTF